MESIEFTLKIRFIQEFIASTLGIIEMITGEIFLLSLMIICAVNRFWSKFYNFN